MNIVKIINKLSIFATMSPCFTLNEIVDFIGSNVDQKLLKTVFLKEPRLIYLHSGSSEEERFILDSTIFRFFSSLNMRLAQLGLFRLTESQINSTMNNLRRNGKWDSPPIELIRWGQSLGLICTCRTRGQYAFPLARILSFLKPRYFDVASNVLTDLCENWLWQSSREKWVENSLKIGFSLFKQNIVHVVKGRVGLLTGRKMTLEEIGATLKFTREYARQLENKFWRHMWSSPRYRRPFLKALLCDIIEHSGSLIVLANSPKALLRSFLANCNFIPQVNLSKIKLVVLGATPEEFISLESTKWFPNEIYPDAIINRLESESQMSLAESDVQELTERIARFRNMRLMKTQRVFLALRAIGRPAHFSEITNVHNSLWPDHASSEHSVHAALGREEYGVVWVGIHGTYGLKEWGYEHPSMGLYDAVAEIVQKMYEKTGMPVPFIVISAEIGKYRKLVKRSSLVMCAHFNPRLRHVAKDSFVPKDPDEEAQDDISLAELDKVFRDFHVRRDVGSVRRDVGSKTT